MTAQNPHIAEFLGELKRHFHPDAAESFWDCEPAFRKLLASSFVLEVINEELRRLSDNPHYQGNWLPTELILHRGGGTAMALSVFDTPHRYLHVLPYHALYAACEPTGIIYDRYRLPSEYRNDVFDPNLRLGPSESGSLNPGDVLRIRSGEFAYDFKVGRPILMLKFMTTAVQPLEWLFHRDTLKAWQANDADLSFTQLRVAADVLGKFAHQSSLNPLKLMTEHPHHAVRWAAIQNLGRLNRSEAVLKLKEAIQDPHPHVQRAARKTLEKLQK